MSSPDSYLFHTPMWSRIMQETFGYLDATKVYEADGGSVLVPIMWRKRGPFLVQESVPSGYGGIVSSGEVQAPLLKRILEDLRSSAGPTGGLLMTPSPSRGVFLQKELGAIAPRVNLGAWNYTHVLSLDKGFDFVWRKFDKKNRNAVRKAEKGSVEVVLASSLESVREYYELYLKSMQGAKGTRLIQPWSLFENLYKFGSSHAQFRLAIRDGYLIGGLIDLRYNKNVFYWGSVFDEEYEVYRPINLLLKDSIQHACSQGYKLYNFGSSGDLEGARRFKESFGAERIGVERYLISSAPIAASYKVFRRLPLRLRSLVWN